MTAEYLLVSDTNSKVIQSSESYQEIKKLASMIRQAGGQVTIFKSLENPRTGSSSDSNTPAATSSIAKGATAS